MLRGSSSSSIFHPCHPSSPRFKPRQEIFGENVRESKGTERNQGEPEGISAPAWEPRRKPGVSSARAQDTYIQCVVSSSGVSQAAPLIVFQPRTPNGEP